ncbi:WGR domain-containing protein [Pyxidicoccus parkwayensis]|uniref:WGR domain-containing protein n=1 Tax=Pyxidicoccus parkwayensis TaxID=2813578 RepID=A0ABX7PAD2_9BACT|nr:WGR domain-containing protein [Pyxidicoccus parkwaysis]QSQ27473.1 WGR domain-containing protein [Pyxidicoccus parkwaysis]
MPRFEFKEGSSNKFWEITRNEAVLTTRWGRIGTEGQEKTQTFKREYEARTAYDKQVLEKTTKGYTRVKPTETGPEPKSNKELEAAILRDPEAAEGYLVYGDWLQSQGDARGELIALQHAQSQAKGAEATALKKKVAALLKKHQGLLLGTQLASMHGGKTLSVDWHLGFIRGARVAVAGYDEDPEFQVDETLKLLLAHPSARFLQELTIGLADNEGENEYGAIIRIIAKSAPGTLRKLFIGDFVFPDDTEISWTHVGNVVPLYKAFPGLRSLHLRGGEPTFGKIDLPELREFIMETGGLDRGSVKAIAAANWPKLQKLEVWFGSENYGASGELKHIQPILDATGLPELKHLGLCNAEFTNELAAALPKSKVLPQLETLDLSRGTLTDEGAAVLLANAAAFKHLKRLDLSLNLLSTKVAKSVAKLCADVVIGRQRQDHSDEEDEHRYVAVGE